MKAAASSFRIAYRIVLLCSVVSITTGLSAGGSEGKGVALGLLTSGGTYASGEKLPMASDFSAHPLRLAVGTQIGMEVWSPHGGAKVVGPVSRSPVEIYNINWSANGNYLAWQQSPLSSQGSGASKVFEFNILTRRTHVWPSENEYFTGLVPGPDGIVAASVGSTQLTDYHLKGTTSSINFALPASAELVANGNAFLAAEPTYATLDPSATESPIAKVSTSGVVTSTAAALPVIPSLTSVSYGVLSASSDGQHFAIELGDHTDVCGVGPSSEISTANTLSGEVVTAGPPAPSDGSVRRVYSMSWSPSGVLDATLFRCGDAVGNSRLPMELWEYAGTVWRQVGSSVLHAARGPGGILAIVSGYLAIQGSAGGGPTSVTRGARELVIGSAHVHLASQAEGIAWAP